MPLLMAKQSLVLCRKLSKWCVVGVCLINLGACKTLDVTPNNEEVPISSQATNKEVQPWAKQQPWFIQLFASEQSKSATAIAELNKYFNSVQNLSRERLKHEISVTKSAYEIELHPAIGLSLAYLYTVKPSIKSTRKAKNILKQLIGNKEVHENYRAFSQLLLRSVVDGAIQRRLLIEARRKNKALNQQLEALKDIELKINERKPTTESL